jgi:hypothetical protein
MEFWVNPSFSESQHHYYNPVSQLIRSKHAKPPHILADSTNISRAYKIDIWLGMIRVARVRNRIMG